MVNSFFSFGLSDKLEEDGTAPVPIGNEEPTRGATEERNQRTSASTSTLKGSNRARSNSSNNLITRSNFFTSSFGAVDRMGRPESFDIAEFYPGSHSFDNEFLLAVVGGANPTEPIRKTINVHHPYPHPHLFSAPNTLQSPPLPPQPVESNESPVLSPVSMEPSIQTVRSNDPRLVRVRTDGEKSPSEAALDVASLHMSSSPHSVKFKAIKNKFETMIQQNKSSPYTPAPSPATSPLYKASVSNSPNREGVAMGHRRALSDNPKKLDY
jgi:hypothetical protein